MTLRNVCVGGGALLLAACGSGGGSTTDTGAMQALTIPSQMTIVDAQGEQTGSLRTPGVARAGGSDYDNDRTRLWVRDESMEPLEIINEILCYVSQCGYDDPDVVNAGPYLALIDVDRCRTNGEERGGQGQQGGSSSDRVEYEEWMIDSSRASNTAPHIVKVWFDSDEERGDNRRVATRMYVKLTIWESPSDTSPYGKFTLNFKCLPRSADPESTNAMFRGTLSTVDRQDGRAEYTFYNSEGDIEATPAVGEFAMRMRARVITEDGGTSGQAFTAMEQRYDWGQGPRSENRTFHVTYNADYLARKKVAGTEEVHVFDRNDFETMAWRYGLYRAVDGSRVELRSGFPLRTAQGAHGWVGYHGMWFPENVTITNGQTLYRETYDPNVTPEEFTAFVQVGKLHKRERVELTLGDVLQEDLWWWDNAGNSIVRWTGSDFVRVAAWSESERRFVRIDPAQSITGNFQPMQWIHFWSDARGDLNVVWPEQGAPNNVTAVTAWQDSVVNGDSPELANGDMSLLGYFQAPRPLCTQSQANFVEGASPFFPEVYEPQNGHAYTFRKSDLMLLQGGEPVCFANGVDPSNGPSERGVWSGPLVTEQPTQVWEIHQAAVSYSWEYGVQDWNQYRTVKDSEGAFVTFDEPLVIEYQHDDPSNARMHGKIFRLEYQGFGELHGLPYEERESGRWYPLITIPTGSIATHAEVSFRVKILEGEQHMREVQNPLQVIQEQGLDLDTTLTPPADVYENPAIGAAPTIATPPLFVGGEKQIVSAN
ncbi:MAG: hypothetical protein IPM29_29040 [Planctomycetes bacterium]|nr:hypothetical protein [Planctomycetota bacterium]